MDPDDVKNLEDDVIYRHSERMEDDHIHGDAVRENPLFVSAMSQQNLLRWPDALKSRIALMRAFLKKDAIRLLDNPADALDDDGEAALVRELTRARGQSTIIMSTHRPSHMRLADKVLWIDDGMVVDFDTPDAIIPKFLATYTQTAAA